LFEKKNYHTGWNKFLLIHKQKLISYCQRKNRDFFTVAEKVSGQMKAAMPVEVESKTYGVEIHWQVLIWMNNYPIQLPVSFQLCIHFSSFIRIRACLLPINLYKSFQ
jgi:hypothetical protein